MTNKDIINTVVVNFNEIPEKNILSVVVETNGKIRAKRFNYEIIDGVITPDQLIFKL